MPCAQSSLEYLLVLAAAMSVLLVLLPSISHALGMVVFAVDSVNARHFAEELSSAAEQALLFSDGTSIEIVARPLGEWVFSVNGKELSLTVVSEPGEKHFLVEMPVHVPFHVSISKKTVFVIKKEGNEVLIENY